MLLELQYYRSPAWSLVRDVCDSSMVCSNWMPHETSGCVRMKRHRSSSSCDSCNTESPSTSFCSSMKYGSNPGTLVSVPKKSAEVFRKDLISAMKLPDSHHIVPEDYYVLSDPWRQEWEKGVQVPASPDNLPQPSVRVLTEQPEEVLFSRQTKWIQSQHPAEMGYVKILELAEIMCRYDLDDMDLYWLEELNAELQEMGEGQAMADKLTMECAMEALERQCHDNMNRAIETEEGLGIEYDEDVVCDVCRSPDSEEGNDMVFCDKCNICVHQACYGIAKVPEGCWLCRTCVLGIDPQCLLCPKKGGAMKATRAGTKWAHISCALWIPEVSIACPERMEPITKVSHIPPSRWTLVCSLCKLKTGACIQCSVKSCVIPFHVTCALEHSLEMKTILDEADEVMFKSYCLKHSKPKVGEAHLSPAIHKPPTDMVKPSSRAQKLQQLEEEFFTLVRSEELTQDVGLPQHLLDFIFQYWKLKRKSNYNKALLPPQEEEDDDKIMQQPTEDSIQTRTRMFVLLRQDLERVRNLCYMVNRREKLKLSHSKVQEQIFNLQVALINHKLITGLPLSCPLETRVFQPPPRIMLKLKVPKVTLGNGKMSSKSNRALSLDRSSNLYKKGDGGWNCGTGQSHRVDHLNGLIPESGRPHGDSRVTCFSAVSVRPSGKPFAFQAALHSRSFNGAGKLERMRSHRSNGRAEKCSTKRDCSFQATGEQDGLLGTLHKSTMENFSRSFKEASGSLARTTQGLQAHNKLQRKGFTKEQVWPKTALEKQGGVPKLCQDNDGYCPDLELSDSDPESESRQHRVWEKGRVTVGVSKLRERGNEGSQGQQPGGPRTSVHR